MSELSLRGDRAVPYPGLRPFRKEEADYFFGREEQIERLQVKLSEKRFVAVAGTSGCGKSSLVHAGLLPSVEEGHLHGPREEWCLAVLRPGAEPYLRLAETLLNDTPVGSSRDAMDAVMSLAVQIRRDGDKGLINVMRQSTDMDRQNLLVVVDQFEELFRIPQDRDTVRAFAALLTTSASESDVPIYILITMRSDFLGQCNIVTELLESVSDGLLILPLLAREQCEAAIRGPARLSNVDIPEPLINSIANEMGTDPDQLPLMQNALMRMWRLAVDRSARNGKQKGRPRIEPADFEHIGRLKETLSRHADEAYQELKSEEQRRIARVMFCLLIEGSGEQATRRPAPVAQIAAVAQVHVRALADVVEPFRLPERSFLTTSVDGEISADVILDISHERLIHWNRLSSWLADEARSAATYQRLSTTARLRKEGNATLLATPELEIAETWRMDENPTKAWAERYGGDFELSMQFLDESIEAREDQLRAMEECRQREEEARIRSEREREIAKRRRVEEQRRQRTIIASLATLAAVIACVAASIAIDRNTALGRLNVSLNVANEQLKAARQEAETQRDRANLSSYNARLARVQEIWRDRPTEAVDILTELKNSEDRLARPSDFAFRFLSRLAKRSPPNLPIDESDSPVISLAFSADGRQLATTSEDGTIGVWDVPSRKEVKELPNRGSVLCVAFSPNDNTLASGHADGTIKLWNVDAGEERSQLKGHVATVRSLAYSPDGNTLISGGNDKTVRLWDAKSGEEFKTLNGHTSWVSAVAVFRDGKMIASAGYDASIRLWRLAKDGRWNHWKTLKGHADTIRALAFSPDSPALASASDDKTVKLWNVERGNAITTLHEHTTFVSAVAYSIDGEIIASGSFNGTMKLWNAKTGQLLSTIDRHDAAVNFLTFSPDGKIFATASSDKTVKLWNAKVGLRMDERQKTLELQIKGAVSVAFAPRDEKLAIISNDLSLSLWDLGQRAEFTPSEFQDIRVTAVAFDLKGRILAMATEDGAIRLCNLEQAVELTAKPLQGHTALVSSLAFSSEGDLLASGDQDGTIRLWNVKAGVQRASEPLEGHSSAVKSLAFPQNSEILASGSEDMTVRLWDTQNGRELTKPLTEHEDWVSCVVFSPDGQKLASADENGEIIIWDLNKLGSAENVQSALPLERHISAVTCLSFSIDGNTLASASLDNTITLWDPVLRQWRAILDQHTQGVRSVAFLDENTLASASDDNTVRLWLAERAVPTERGTNTTRE